MQQQRSKKPVWFVAAFVAIAIVVAILLLPTMSGFGTRGASRRSICKNNLKQIGLALHHYHQDYGTYPPAYFADERGRPTHSWHVLLLPYLDQLPLYKRYRFDEPWDGPHNRALADARIPAYQCPSEEGAVPGETNYFAVIGPHCAWTGKQSVSKSDIADSPNETIQLVEASKTGIRWSEPRDLSMNQIPLEINPKRGLGISSHHENCASILFCSGSVRILENDFAPGTLRQMLDRHDGKPVEKIGD